MTGIEFRENFVHSDVLTKTKVAQVVSVLPRTFRKEDGTESNYAKIQIRGLEKMLSLEMEQANTVLTEMSKGAKIYAEYINILNAENKTVPKLCNLYYVE